MIRKITCRHFPHFWFQSSPQVEAIRTVGSVPKQKTQHFGQPRPHQGSAMQRSLTTGDLLTPGSKAQILMILVNYSFLYWNKNVLLFLPFFFFSWFVLFSSVRGGLFLCVHALLDRAGKHPRKETTGFLTAKVSNGERDLPLPPPCVWQVRFFKDPWEEFKHGQDDHCFSEEHCVF